MNGLQSAVAPLAGRIHALFRLLCLVARNVVVALDVRADGDKDNGLVSTGYADDAIRASHLAAVGLDGHTPLKAHLAFQSLMLRTDTQQRGFIAFAAYQHIFMR